VIFRGTGLLLSQVDAAQIAVLDRVIAFGRVGEARRRGCDDLKAAGFTRRSEGAAIPQSALCDTAPDGVDMRVTRAKQVSPRHWAGAIAPTERGGQAIPLVLDQTAALDRRRGTSEFVPKQQH
jgi:hypothetical protein